MNVLCIPALLVFGIVLLIAMAVVRWKTAREYRQRLERGNALLREAVRKAETANAARNAFLFGMSHDIRTPMNAITGFTDIALENLHDRDRLRDCLTKTREACGNLLSIVDTVLDMSSIESGKACLTETVGDVRLSFVNIEEDMQQLARTRGISLTFDIGAVTDCYVHVDMERCARVFVNLISNALRYTKKGGHVRVRCEQVGAKNNGRATFRYVFEDDGIGMSAEFQKRAFELFAREESPDADLAGGAGVGLALCKAFVEMMGGEITCSSRKGEGSTFTVVLPFRVQEKSEYIDPKTGKVVAAVSENAVPTGDSSFSGRKVLLVEDNDLNREIAEYMLQERGMTVETAADGSIAVNLVRERGPGYYDFILMDIQMPVMNGYEATRAIRSWESGQAQSAGRVPIIALSANAFAEDRSACLAAGMNDHVAKPIKIKTLFDCLAKHTRRSV